MSAIFARLYTLEVGSGTTSVIYDKQTIEADIRYSSKSNTTTKDEHVIKLLNPGPELTQILQGDPVNVILRGGYRHEDGTLHTLKTIPVIYVGSVTYSETKRLQNDMVTTLVCQSAGDTLQKAVLGVDIPAGTRYSRLLATITSVFGLPTYVSIPSSVDHVTTKVTHCQGSAAEIIQKLCIRWGFVFYVFNGAVYVVHTVAKNLAYKQSNFTIPASKILGTPTFVRDTKKSTTANKDTNISFETTLDGRIGLGSEVTIGITRSGATVTGTYTVETVHHKMQLRGKNWRTIVTAKVEPAKNAAKANTVSGASVPAVTTGSVAQSALTQITGGS